MVEEDVETAFTHNESGALKWLAVADADAVATGFTGLHRKVRAYPVNLVRIDLEAETAESLVVMALANIHAVGLSVRCNHKDGILVPANAKAFPLADSIELRALVPANYYPIGVSLVAGFLDVFLAAAVGFRFKCDIVTYRSCEPVKIFIRERYLRERTLSKRLSVRCENLLLRSIMNRAVKAETRLQKAREGVLLPLVKLVIGIICIKNLHNVSFHGSQFLLQECGKVHLTHKADTLGVLFLSRWKIGLLGYAPYLRLHYVPDGEKSLGKLLLGELAEEIRLVLVWVCALQDAENALTGDLLPAAVMPRCHVMGPVFPGNFPEGVKLDFTVAEDIRIWGAAL